LPRNQEPYPALPDASPRPKERATAFRDKEFCRLFEVAVAARRHHIAVGIAAALRAINSPDRPMPRKSDYQRRHHHHS
jgi:hypothetical protein